MSGKQRTYNGGVFITVTEVEQTHNDGSQGTHAPEILIDKHGKD